MIAVLKQGTTPEQTAFLIQWLENMGLQAHVYASGDAAILGIVMAGAGIGGNLANKAWIEAGEYHKITETAKKLVAAVRSV